MLLCWGGAALAQPTPATEPATPTPVVITGARFASDPALAPIGATVIDADQIRRAGMGDVNQAIRKIGGVAGRQSLDGSPDFSLDLGAFGDTGNQNMVLLLDGVRLSENELRNAALSTIPIDSVERIEISRGGASVLYGEGATGGVINIITRRPSGAAGPVRGALFAELGQFGQREGRAALSRSWGQLALDAALGAQQTDNYRDNNGYRQRTFSGGVQWREQAGRIGLRLDLARQRSRFAGSLSQAQYEADARQSVTPDDFGSLDSTRVTGFAERRVGEFDLAAELSHTARTVDATYVGDGARYLYRYDTRRTQFSPRARRLDRVDGMLNEWVAGLDLAHWRRATAADFSQADANQRSQAVYVRDELRLPGAHAVRLALGARQEHFRQQSHDPAPFGAAPYRASQRRRAWEAQGSVKPLPWAELYLKAGQSYRVANADENGLTLDGAPLKGQSAHDLELGASVGDARSSLSARLFRHDVKDEIYYDPTAGRFGSNVNLDPTRHQGVELDGSAALGPDWRVSGHAQHARATFTAGPNSGKEMVLLPNNIVTARLAWLGRAGHRAELGVQWTDRQRYGGDFDNSCAARMPAYTTVDARYARVLGAWELAVSGLNLADRRYAGNAFGCRAGIYPGDGRQVKASARYDF
ncbi:MAG: TonB-dependent receptor [Pseudomonadota bacterium]